MNYRRILGIETSCDETGVALVEEGKVVSALVATQQVHAEWGGVVPELASRLHQRTLAKMVNEILNKQGWIFQQLDGVAATRGPGLIGALLVGVSYAKGLAVALDIPYCGINHLEAHLWAVGIEGQVVSLPALALLVSGGHTELIQVEKFGRYRFLGGTLDDAAGEAFDKIGGLLGIPYPAGAELNLRAIQGNPKRFPLPIAETKNPLDFSFSGLKTAALRLFEQLKRDARRDDWQSDFAASFQLAVVTQITRTLTCALTRGDYKSLILSGGVAANTLLRIEAASLATQYGIELHIPSIANCTDNGAIVAYLGAKYLNLRGGDPLDQEADPNLDLT